LHHWDTATACWVIEPGDYDLVVSASADDEHARIRITIVRPATPPEPALS